MSEILDRPQDGYIDNFKKLDSGKIKLIPNFEIFAGKINKNDFDAALINGISRELIERSIKLRYEGVTLLEAKKELINNTSNPLFEEILENEYSKNSFYKEPDFEGLKEILPYCISFQGKFNYMSEACHESSIPYNIIVPIIKDRSYSGYIMSDYGNFKGYNSLEMLRRHIKMMKYRLSK